MRIADATREADRTLDYGWFRPDDMHVYLLCHRCGARVGNTVKPWASEQQRITAARDGLAEHLTGCEEGGACDGPR